VATAVRLFVVFMFLRLVQAIPDAVRLLGGPDGAALGGLYVAAALVAVSVCALLWFFPLTIARKFLPAMREPRSEQTLGPGTALSVGITLIGVWLLANSSVELFYWFGLMLRDRQVGLATGATVDWSAEQFANVFAATAQLVIGTGLTLGGPRVRRLIERFRYGNSAGAP